MIIQNDHVAEYSAERNSLRSELARLRIKRPKQPSYEQLRSIIGDGLISQSMSRREWYNRALWGFYAARILKRSVIKRLDKEVLGIVEDVDWSVLDNLQVRNHGVLIVTNHLGPTSVLQPLLENKYPSIQTLTANQNRKSSLSNLIYIENDSSKNIASAKAFLKLRKNGMVRLAADGRMGAETSDLEILIGENTVRVAKGAGELACISKSPVCYISAQWRQARSIHVEFRELTVDDSIEQKGAWIKEWYAQFFSFLFKQIILKPEDIGFRSGCVIWRDRMGL